jgi:glycerol-3-phosphate dehydrogenase
MMTREYVRTAEDAVWRRTKLGLRLSKDQIATIDDWIKTQEAKS